MIYVMRHAESTVNLERRLTCKQLEGDLTPLGVEQAHKAATFQPFITVPSTGHSKPPPLSASS